MVRLGAIFKLRPEAGSWELRLNHNVQLVLVKRYTTHALDRASPVCWRTAARQRAYAKRQVKFYERKVGELVSAMNVIDACPWMFNGQRVREISSKSEASWSDAGYERVEVAILPRLEREMAEAYRWYVRFTATVECGAARARRAFDARCDAAVAKLEAMIDRWDETLAEPVVVADPEPVRGLAGVDAETLVGKHIRSTVPSYEPGWTGMVERVVHNRPDLGLVTVRVKWDVKRPGHFARGDCDVRFLAFA